MNKSEFLSMLKSRLAALPPAEIDRSVNFYAEMIDDRIEEGMNETEAVAAVGDIDKIVSGIFAERPLSEVIGGMQPNRSRQTWQIVLIVLGFPLWFPLLAAFFAVVASVYISVWAVIISLYAAVAALALGGLAGCVASVFGFAQSIGTGVALFGASLVCIGIGIIAFFIVNQLSVMLIRLTELFGRKIKSMIMKRREKI